MKLGRIPVFLFVTGLLFTAACFRKDVVTVPFDVPQLKSADCTKFIIDALNTNKIDGLKAATPDTVNHKVLVTYDTTKLGRKNVEFLIAGAGYDVNDTVAPPEVKSKLPPGCR